MRLFSFENRLEDEELTLLLELGQSCHAIYNISPYLTGTGPKRKSRQASQSQVVSGNTNGMHV